jgi:putative addiction module component (TIGR02574 family)
MAVSINTLLALPQKERRKIAEKLWGSLSPVQSISREEKDVLALLEKRWKDIESGKSKQYSASEMKKMIAVHRNK